MKRLITMICLVAALAGRAAAQGAVYGDIALAGSVSLTNLYGQPAAVWAAQRQGGAWTNDGAHVWYRLAATNRHGRSGWVYSTNDVVLNVATGRQSATVSWTNALGGVSGYLLQRRETTNSVADPAAATNAALWTRWQALSPRVGAVLDISWTNWSTNAWADLPGWDHARTYPWATPADIATGTVSHAATAGTAASAGTAATADRLNDTVGTNSWAVLANGTQQVYVVSYSQVVCTDTTVVRVASAIVDMEEPPDYSAAVGDIWAWNPAGYYERQNWKLLAGWRVRDEHGDASNNIGASPTNIVYYHDTFWELSFEFPLATNSVPVTNIYPLARSADLAAHNDDGSAHADIRAAITEAPEWVGVTNLAASVTLTNVNERPIFLYSTGTVSLAISGLRPPLPLYLIIRGPDSLTIPGAYYVGGATWQTNRSNHFVCWTYGTNLLVNAVTTTED